MEDQEYTIDLMEVAEIISENRKPIAKITGVFIALLKLPVCLLRWQFYICSSLLRCTNRKRCCGSNSNRGWAVPCWTLLPAGAHR